MAEAQEVLMKMALELKSRSTAQVVTEAGSYYLVGFVILTGNVLTLLIFWLNRRLHTASNIFVASLALTDLSVAALTAIPLGASALATSGWPFSDATCQYQGFIVISMVVASTQTLGWMAVNRYFRVVKPAKYRRYFTVKSSIRIVAVTWFLAFLAPLPYLFAGNRFVFHPAKFFCYIHINSGPYTAFIGITYVALPSAAIAFCYFRVFQTVRRHNSNLQNSRENKRVMVEEIKVTKILFMIVVFYMLCWTPVLLIDLMDTFRGRWSFTRPAYMSYSFLGTISSAINPIIYGVMNKAFRHEYKRVLTCGRNGSAVAPHAHARPDTRKTHAKSGPVLVVEIKTINTAPCTNSHAAP